jgi:hypothetical protein
MNYIRVKYEDYKSEKLISPTALEMELEKALDNGVDDVKVWSFYRQHNGLYQGFPTRYYFKNGKWKIN